MPDSHDDGCRCQGCCAAKFKRLDPAAFGKAPPMAETELLEEIYAQHGLGFTRRASGMVFRWVFDALERGAVGVARCDAMLGAVDVARIGVTMAIGFLSATFLARHLLPSRVALLDQAMAHAVGQVGERQAEAMFRSLR